MTPTASWGWFLLETTAKTSLLLLIAGVFAFALRRSSAAVRHLVWTAGVFALLLAPPLSKLVPQWRVPVAVPASSSVGPAVSPAWRVPGGVGQAVSPANPSPIRDVLPAPTNYWPWAVAIWVLGASALAIFFTGGALHLSRIARTAQAVDDERIAAFAEQAADGLGVPRGRFRLRWSARATTPMTWGLWRPVLLLPSSSARWHDDRLRHVLVHEIAHIRRWDVGTQALSTLACVLYWFNPLAWWAARQMLVERERACDDLVLGHGAKPSDYAHGLLDIARSLGADWTTARVSPAMARRSQISGRLLAVLDDKRRRHDVHKPVVIAGAAAALALLLPAASLSLAPRTPPFENSRAAVLAAEASWRAAFRHGDAAAMAGFYTTDALLVLPDGNVARGRRGVTAVLAWLISQGVVDIDIEPAEIYPIGETVCEAGRATFWRSGGGVALTIQFMTLWKKENGEWRIHRDFGAPQGEQR